MNQFLQQKEEGKLFTHFRSLEIEKDKKKTEKKSLEIILGYSTETEHFKKEIDSMSS